MLTFESVSLLGSCCGRLASLCWELRHQLEHALNEEAVGSDGRPWKINSFRVQGY